MKKLEMGNTSSTRVDHTCNDVTVEEVRVAMDAAIERVVFKSKKGELKEVDSADVVELI